MLSHCNGSVHVGVSVCTGVDAEGADAAQADSHQLNLIIPTALRHQDVSVLGFHPEQLCCVVGVPASKGLEVREHCLIPANQKLYREALLFIRSVLA